MDTLETSEGAASQLPEANDLAQGLGLLVHNTLKRHWFSSSDERDSLIFYYALLSGCLMRVDEVLFRLLGNTLTLNGQEVDEGEQNYVRTLREQMSALQIGNFALQRGVTTDDLRKVVHLLASDPDEVRQVGGFAAALATVGVGHVTSKTLVYKEVSEDDVVVSRKNLTAATRNGAAASPQASPEEMIAHLAAPGPEDAAPDAPPTAAQAAIRALADDSDRLAGLVMQAARTSPGTDDGLAGALVGCIRRAFSTLLHDEAAQTQKGRKQLQKQLRDLEKQLLDLLQKDVVPEKQAPCLDAVRETVDELTDDLKINALSAEYVKRLKAIEQTERRLKRFMKDRGEEALQAAGLEARMEKEGVASERWMSMLRSGRYVLASAETMQQLAPLLSRMQEAANALSLNPDAANREQMRRALATVHAELGALVERTAHKIRTVSEDIQSDAPAVEKVEQVALQQGIGLRLSRSRLLALLAELVQELCQPLAVINCSVDMVMSRMMGDVPDSQMEVLKLVADGVTKLQELVGSLQKVAGVPSTMAPDKALLREASDARS